jgi:hypothetical protein
MKKQILLLAGSALILASCGSNNNPPAQSQAQIDSAVNAKLAEHDAANAAKNDSTLKAMEKEKADAMAKEHVTTTTTKKHTVSKKEEATPPPPPPPPPPPVNVRPGATGPKSVNDRPGAH